MKTFIGLNEYQLSQKNAEEALFWQPETLTNNHILIAGSAGTGKTTQSMRLLQAVAYQGIQTDVFDVHEEFADIQGSSTAKYSQSTRFGYNPLVIDPDLHAGGPDRQAGFLVNLIREVSPEFGNIQENALRHLVMDLYAANGIFRDNPSTWLRQEITERQRADLIAGKQWESLKNFYPTLGDLQDYARRKIRALTIGADNKAAIHLENLLRLVATQHRNLRKQHKEPAAVDIERKIEETRAKCIDSYRNAVNSLETGKELDDILKYNSADTLSGVYRRLDLLNSAGIFCANAPDFDSNFRVHQIKDLLNEQQVLLVKTRLKIIFETAKRLGKVPHGELRHVIFLDEAHKFFNDDPNDIISIIAKEARKFGIGLWCATQNPTAFPEEFLSNCGCKIFTGIDASYWKKVTSMFRISVEGLKFIRAKQSIAVKLQLAGHSDPPFNQIVIPNPNTIYGRRCADSEKRF